MASLQRPRRARRPASRTRRSPFRGPRGRRFEPQGGGRGGLLSREAARVDPDVRLASYGSLLCDDTGKSVLEQLSFRARASEADRERRHRRRRRRRHTFKMVLYFIMEWSGVYPPSLAHRARVGDVGADAPLKDAPRRKHGVARALNPLRDAPTRARRVRRRPPRSQEREGARQQRAARRSRSIGSEHSHPRERTQHGTRALGLKPHRRLLPVLAQVYGRVSVLAAEDGDRVAARVEDGAAVAVAHAWKLPRRQAVCQHALLARLKHVEVRRRLGGRDSKNGIRFSEALHGANPVAVGRGKACVSPETKARVRKASAAEAEAAAAAWKEHAARMAERREASAAAAALDARAAAEANARAEAEAAAAAWKEQVVYKQILHLRAEAAESPRRSAPPPPPPPPPGSAGKSGRLLRLRSRRRPPPPPPSGSACLWEAAEERKERKRRRKREREPPPSRCRPSRQRGASRPRARGWRRSATRQR